MCGNAFPLVFEVSTRADTMLKTYAGMLAAQMGACSLAVQSSLLAECLIILPGQQI